MPVSLDILPSVPNQRVSTTLEDRQYIFDLRWNARDGVGAWYMDVYTDAEEIIRYGIKLVRGVPLGRRTRDTRFPPGAMFCIANTDDPAEAGLDDIGIRVQVTYFTVAELTEMAESFGT